MSIVIKAENVSKKYTIGHQKEEKYLMLRDVIANKIKSFGKKIDNSDLEDFWALKDINFEVEQGDRVGIIGRNGAGKSTLLKVISKITEPTTGTIKMRGRISSLLEVGTGFHPELTGRENIFLNGAILGMKKSEIKRKFDEIVAFSEVGKFIDTPVKRYSSGMYVRLAFAVAAHLEPEILIVDEVLAVGDMQFQKKCLGKMKDVGKEGRTIIFVSHDLSSIRAICNKGILLSQGKVKAFGESGDITRLYEIDSQPKDGESGAIQIRDPKPKNYHLERVELRNSSNKPCNNFEAGDDMFINLWTNGPAPQDSFTIEFKLRNERGNVISFGSANPVRQTYYNREDTHFVCKLKTLPLTSGKYKFDFSIRVWGMERWDYWEDAINFNITKCDLYNTGFDIPAVAGGDFVINQNWDKGD